MVNIEHVFLSKYLFKVNIKDIRVKSVDIDSVPF